MIDLRQLGLTKSKLPPAEVYSSKLASRTVPSPTTADSAAVSRVSHAILSGATAQLRNMATAGGNLLQRTRCPYFMEAVFDACNKRNPGSGCAARHGFNREHAIFGASDGCVAVPPSDMAVALAILDAAVHVQGPQGSGSFRSGFLRSWRDPGGRQHAAPGGLILGIAATIRLRG